MVFQSMLFVMAGIGTGVLLFSNPLLPSLQGSIYLGSLVTY